MKPLFTGTGVALVTPFHKYGTVDFNSLRKIIEHTLKGKVDYLVVLGTTGETATMSKDERNAVCGFVLEVVDGRVPVIVGMGGNNTQDIIDNISGFDFTGIDGILVVTPYYNKPQQKGLYYHYKSIAAISPLPIILYNVPGRTGCNMTADTTLKLANEFSNIAAIKEASGNMNQIMKIIKERPAGFRVISGDDALTLPMIAAGADGVISVVANVCPAEFSKMVHYAMQGNFAEARKYHYMLFDLIETLFEDGSPSGVKAALEIKGLSLNNLRLPLVKVNKAVLLQLQVQLEDMAK